jgi:hypothetical protein
VDDRSHKIEIEILSQPDDSTCGPTCLHSVYRFYHDEIDLKSVIKEVHRFEGGGTLAVWLACHALKRGYEATIFTYNLQVFDPTWFPYEKDKLIKLLDEQMVFKKDAKLILATRAYQEFLELGGKLKLEDLTRDLLRKHLNQNIPVLTGTNANFLYRSAREYGNDNILDSVRGEPAGHFVVLTGYDRDKKLVTVADPLLGNPYSKTQKYDINIDRVIDSILLGILTYDANFLIIKPKKDVNGKSPPTP